jgi:hypothetical protein
MQITQTTVLSVLGTQISTVPNNINLAATAPSISTQRLAGTNFTVDATNGAIPTNFRQVAGYPIADGGLEFAYEWDSSSGNPADLARCSVGELVTYPGGNPFVWGVPYSNSGFDFTNPFITITPATNFMTAFSHIGTGDDQNRPPFVKPYAYNDFTAQQKYRFQCSNYKNNAWIDLTATNPIERLVNRLGNGIYSYTITKSGISSAINPLP